MNKELEEAIEKVTDMIDYIRFGEERKYTTRVSTENEEEWLDNVG